VFSVTLAFDSKTISVNEIAQIEEGIWTGLKLSGEYNRVLRDDQWVLHFVTEKKIKEEALQKIKGVEHAIKIQTKDLIEDGRGRKKKDDDLEDDLDVVMDEEDED
jgi:hypothetical protein